MVPFSGTAGFSGLSFLTFFSFSGRLSSVSLSEPDHSEREKSVFDGHSSESSSSSRSPEILSASPIRLDLQSFAKCPNLLHLKHRVRFCLSPDFWCERPGRRLSDTVLGRRFSDRRLPNELEDFLWRRWRAGSSSIIPNCLQKLASPKHNLE